MIVVSAAPDGELPIIRTGVFAQLHPLINEVWAELQRRDPLLPDPSKTTEKVVPPKPATAAATKPAATGKPADADKPAEDGAVDTTDDPEAKEAETPKPDSELPAGQPAPSAAQPAISKDQMSLFGPPADEPVTSDEAVIVNPLEMPVAQEEQAVTEQ